MAHLYLLSVSGLSELFNQVPMCPDNQGLTLVTLKGKPQHCYRSLLECCK